jgi:hypothetical protein
MSPRAPRPTFEECLAAAYEEHVTAFYDELEQSRLNAA